MEISHVLTAMFPSIQHLFFSCAHAKFLWRAVHVVFGLSQPSSVDDLFNRWCKVGDSKHNLLLQTAASAICWTIWISRNEVVFDKCKPKSYLQVLFRERIGYANGLYCSVMSINTLLSSNVSSLRRRHFESLRPLVGYRRVD